MDFLCIVLFLALYYLKPQEWTSLFSTIHFVQLTMLAALSTLIFRERNLKARDFFRTPQDWAVIGFLVWIFVSSPTPMDTFKEEIVNRFIFYAVTVQTLYSLSRLNRFLAWWTFFLTMVAFLALAGEYFWDPLGSNAITHSIMKGRLILNLSIVNNPNALAHSIVPGIAMIYFFAIWKRPIGMKALGVVGLVIIGWAVYLTVSKGGFLVGGAIVLAMYTFGRPKYVQIIITVLLVTSGTVLLYSLPRMTELKNTKKDEAIQGRVMSLTHGYYYYQTYPKGVGMGQFMKRQLAEFKLSKAPHSVYNAIGAQQGKTGMFLFLLIMWTSFRTLVFMKSQTVEQERARRVLFVLLISYAISGWMADFAYRPSFFLMIAAISVMHRLFLLQQVEEAPIEEGSGPAWRRRPAGPAFVLPETIAPTLRPLPTEPGHPAVAVLENPKPKIVLAQPEPDEPAPPPPTKTSQGIGLLDLIMTLVAMKLVEMLWVYFINHI